jgi:hypothetical protein
MKTRTSIDSTPREDDFQKSSSTRSKKRRAVQATRLAGHHGLDWAPAPVDDRDRIELGTAEQWPGGAFSLCARKLSIRTSQEDDYSLVNLALIIVASYGNRFVSIEWAA